MCMQRHSTFIPLVAVFKFVANGDRSQKVANAFLAYPSDFSVEVRSDNDSGSYRDCTIFSPAATRPRYNNFQPPAAYSLRRPSAISY